MAFLEFSQQVEDLGLDRHVQRRGGLVGDQQFGTARQGHGDHGALPHAAGQFVGILVHPLPRTGYADLGKGLHSVRTGMLPVHAVVQAEGFADLVPHGVYRVEGGHGFLEDHGDFPAPDSPHGIAILLEIVNPDA